MATLTRTRPSFQDESEVEPRRPLHLDIPTPFPNRKSSTSISHNGTFEQGQMEPGSVDQGQAAKQVDTASVPTEHTETVSPFFTVCGCPWHCMHLAHTLWMKWPFVVPSCKNLWFNASLDVCVGLRGNHNPNCSNHSLPFSTNALAVQ